MKTRNQVRFLARLWLGFVIAGCSGGDGGEAAPPGTESSDESPSLAEPGEQAQESGGEQEGCVPGGGGFLRMELSGAVVATLDWDNGGTECGGFGGLTQSMGFERDLAGEGTRLAMSFMIQIEEGETGENLPLRVQVNDQGQGRMFATEEWGGCTIDVTEQALLQENPAMRIYRLAANGRCTAPAVQFSGPSGVETGEVTIGDFELTGVAVWMGP